MSKRIWTESSNSYLKGKNKDSTQNERNFYRHLKIIAKEIQVHVHIQVRGRVEKV